MLASYGLRVAVDIHSRSIVSIWRFQYSADPVDIEAVNWLSVVVATILLQAVSISVSPESGLPGGSFVVSGSGFQEGERVRVLWDGTNLGGTAKADTDGTFRFEGAVPVAAPVGSHTIEARGKSGSARTSFAVVAPSTTTTASTTTSTAPTTTLPAPTSTAPSTTTATSSPSTTFQASPSTALPVATTTTAGVTPSTTAVAAFSPQGVGSPPTTGARLAPRHLPVPGEAPNENGWWWLVALGAMAVGAVFLWWLRRARPSTTAPSEPVPEPVLTVARPTVEGSEGAWIRHRLQLAPNGKFCAAAGMDGGFVGFGSTTDDEERAAVWVSRSGISWESWAVLEPGRASAAVPWRGGMLMLGTLTAMPFTACSWWSGPGSGWHLLTAADDPALAGVSFEGAAATEDAVVAFGRGPKGPRTWFTTDGRAWQPSTLRGAIDLIAPVPGGAVAFGRHLEERRPLLARSTDGISWEEAPLDNVFMFEGVAMVAALPFGGGLVAAGTDKMKGAATVWVSDDGVSWHRTPFEPDQGTSIEHLTVVDGRLVAVGTDAGRRRTGRPSSLAIWESADAVHWERSWSDGLFAAAGATAVASDGAHVLICGVLAAGHGSPWSEPVPVSWIREMPVRADTAPVAAQSEPALVSS